MRALNTVADGGGAAGSPKEYNPAWTIGEALKRAYEAGRKYGDTAAFPVWLRKTGQEGRGALLRSRLEEEFRRAAEGEPERVVEYKGAVLSLLPGGEWSASVEPESRFDGLAEAKQFVDTVRRRNPLDMASVLGVGVLAGAVQGIVEPYVTRHVYGQGAAGAGAAAENPSSLPGRAGLLAARDDIFRRPHAAPWRAPVIKTADVRNEHGAVIRLTVSTNRTGNRWWLERLTVWPATGETSLSGLWTTASGRAAVEWVAGIEDLERGGGAGRGGEAVRENPAIPWEPKEPALYTARSGSAEARVRPGTFTAGGVTRRGFDVFQSDGNVSWAPALKDAKKIADSYAARWGPDAAWRRGKGKGNPGDSGGRFYAAPDDWPLRTPRKWWAVYDSETGEKVHITGYGKRPVYGSERLAQKAADKLNRGARKGNPYGEPEFRRPARFWSGQMGGAYWTKAEAVREAAKFAEEKGWDEVMIWTSGGGKRESFIVRVKKGKRKPAREGGEHAA